MYYESVSYTHLSGNPSHIGNIIRIHPDILDMHNVSLHPTAIHFPYNDGYIFCNRSNGRCLSPVSYTHLVRSTMMPFFEASRQSPAVRRSALISQVSWEHSVLR